MVRSGHQLQVNVGKQPCQVAGHLGIEVGIGGDEALQLEALVDWGGPACVGGRESASLSGSWIAAQQRANLAEHERRRPMYTANAIVSVRLRSA